MYYIFTIGDHGIRHLFATTPHENKAQEVAVSYSKCHGVKTEIFDTDYTCSNWFISASGLEELHACHEIDFPFGITVEEAYYEYVPVRAEAEVWTTNGKYLTLDYGSTHEEYYDNYLVSRIEANEDETHFRIYVEEE